MSDEQSGRPPGLAEPGLKLRLEEKLGWLDDLRIVAYRGYGTRHSLHVRGRLIEAKGEAGTGGDEPDGVLANVLTTLRRLDSDEIPGAKLLARHGGRDFELFTDAEGFFQLNLYVDDELAPGWHDVQLELADSVAKGAQSTAEAKILVPHPDCEFAVISDLDDTVIESQATNKLAQARLTLMNDGASRVPVPGIAALYDALRKGAGGGPDNPLFYLSRSGWNFYDMFIEFMEAHGVPAGPMFLRDLAFREAKSAALGATHHKLQRVRELLQQYPQQKFVLIGDTGQDDAERYQQIVIEFPGRIRSVYLRDVEKSDASDDVERILDYLSQRGVATGVGADASDFAGHMAEEGLIAPGVVQTVRDARDRVTSESTSG